MAVAGNWQDITAGIKLAGLLTIATTVIVGAERARSSLPATGRAMAHLGAALVAPVVIAASAMAGQRWPVCVFAGGALAAVACDVQARRWRAPLLDAATIIAIGLALTGVAALVPVPDRRARRGRRVHAAVSPHRDMPRPRSPWPARRLPCSWRSPSNGSEPGRSTGSARRVRS